MLVINDFEEVQARGSRHLQVRDHGIEGLSFEQLQRLRAA